MKKTFQKIDISVEPNSVQVITEKLNNEYSKCSGVFIVKKSGTLTNVALQLKIAGYEILPIGTDAILIVFNGEFPLEQAVYNFGEDNIPALSHDAELTVVNNENTKQEFRLYYILEK